jgi:hypothetical protein
MADDRFDRLISLSQLAPRFFHIQDESDGFCCGELQLLAPEDLPQLADELIERCKPGIWKSIFRGEDGGHDAIALWVAEGQIDLAKSVEKWADDEKKLAAKFKLGADEDDVVANYTWKCVGSCSQDGGSGSMIAKSYLTVATAKEIMGAKDDEEIDMEEYLQMLVLTGKDDETENPDNVGYTIGGLSCKSLLSFLWCQPLFRR